MSGRIVPSNRVKRGEVLPPEYEALGEETQDPLRYSAQIEAVYLEAQRRDREVFAIDKLMMKKELEHYGQEYDLSDPTVREMVMNDIEYKHSLPGLKGGSPLTGEQPSVKLPSKSVKEHAYNVGSREKMRAKVLAHSLYPNLNNKKFLLGSM